MADETTTEPKAGEPGYYNPPKHTGPHIPVAPFPPEPAAATAEGEEVDYESMTVVELKALAQERGVTITPDMHKADIVAALQA